MSTNGAIEISGLGAAPPSAGAEPAIRSQGNISQFLSLCVAKAQRQQSAVREALCWDSLSLS